MSVTRRRRNRLRRRRNLACIPGVESGDLKRSSRPLAEIRHSEEPAEAQGCERLLGAWRTLVADNLLSGS